MCRSPSSRNGSEDALDGLIALGFRGCNVAMPHKQTAMPLLDRVNETAKCIGAVNTIVARSRRHALGLQQ